ncbi:hypothetical protein Tsubulata_049538 [Turnera subulata]|uniref:Uncharacterized protein n=1 Tax=Turnera subulata TaxID=218843 RepID=A0A9Q0JNQ4_9ROSI|nr:hypothetical protein Tsubulata_050756 [Turnera subulata]KAJ4849601.1 hypothetical protein Tsubulata_049538 [Turnera subulata]
MKMTTTTESSSMEKKKTTTTRPRSRRVCFSSIDDWCTEWYTIEITDQDDDDREIVRCCGCGGCPKRMRHDTTGSPPLLPRATLINEEERSQYSGSWAVLGEKLYFLGVEELAITPPSPGDDDDSNDDDSYHPSDGGDDDSNDDDGDQPAPDPTPRIGGFSSDFVSITTVLAFDLTIGDDNNDVVGPALMGLNQQWVHKPDMFIPRDEVSKTVVVGEKIYVFEAGYDDREHPWAEVYDPTSNTWDALPDPPFLPHEGFFLAGLEPEEEDDDDDKKKGGGSIIILSVIDGVLMEYDVVSKSWKNKDVPGGDLPNETQDGYAVAVGRVMYWFCIVDHCLYGLDLDTYVLYTSKALVDLREPMLGHFGGNRFFMLYDNRDTSDDLCLQRAPAPPLPDGTKDTTFLHCWKFSVSLDSSSRTLAVSQESSQSFVIKVGNFRRHCALF